MPQLEPSAHTRSTRPPAAKRYPLVMAATPLLAALLALPPAPDADRELFVDHVAALLDVVAAEHIDPPATRDLLVAGVEELGRTVGADLSAFEERAPASHDAAREFLGSLYDATGARGDIGVLVNGMVRGVSMRVPGGAMAVNAETARVNDSLDGNRYVGVGVVLDFSEGRPVIRDTYFGGPAHRGGILPGDVVYEVDGHDTAGMDVGRFLDYSRDEVGTELVYVVGQPGSEERRVASLVRSVVPRETVVGTERAADERWRHRLDGSTVAYARLTGITASTAHELRKAADRIREERLHGLVLDLTACRSNLIHDAALVADLFRREGVMGASATRTARAEYRAGPDALFDPRRVVVLVDGTTRGSAEWLAAVLRAGGARIVGEATAGVPFLRRRVEVPGWPVEVELPTGWMLDPEADEARPLRSVAPDHPVDDPDRALAVARGLLERRSF